MKKLQKTKVRGWILIPPVIIYTISVILVLIHSFNGFLEPIKDVVFAVGAISLIWLLLSVTIVALSDYEKRGKNLYK